MKNLIDLMKCFLLLLGILLMLWIVAWWPIYGFIWLLAGWTYLILFFKIKIALIAAALVVAITYDIFHRKNKELRVYFITYRGAL